MQSRRSLVVNWRALNGAAYIRRKLKIRPNNESLFTCPVKLCLHDDFKSSRGLRKHLNAKHPWYFYFDEQPQVKREHMERFAENPRKRASTTGKPTFSMERGIGFDFLQWLTTSCGGGKTQKQALQIGNRGMKFLMDSMDAYNTETELTSHFIDCCLGSASIIVGFLMTLEKEWKLSSSGSLNYIRSLCDLVDFRKANGVSDNTLRYFAITEVYLRRAKENLRKRKNIECTRNLDVETLIARDSWATIEEMEEVIPFHLKQFTNIIEKCKSEDVVTKAGLVFCTRFIVTLLFLRVKCSRPMTYMYLTVGMIEKAKSNGGFVDQTEFKTSSTYYYDTLIFSQDVLSVVELYMFYIRPRLNPSCDFLLVSLNGTQYQSLTNAMVMMVHHAIGKHINPTRYRQIVETESSDRLSLEEQHYVSEDQKHSSQVAKIYYKKKLSRQAAIEGKKCMDKMTHRSGSANLMTLIAGIDNSFDQDVLKTSHNIISHPVSFVCGDGASSSTYQPSSDNILTEQKVDACQSIQNDLNESTDLTIMPNSSETSLKGTVNIVHNVPVNSTVMFTRKQLKNVKFSNEEDEYLNEGITKYGRKSWANILRDKSFIFNKSRTRDSLRIRAESMAFKKRFSSILK